LLSSEPSEKSLVTTTNLSIINPNAKALAKLQQQESQNKQAVQEDALAPHELSWDAELLQAKL